MKARVKATGRIIQVMNVMDEKGNSVWEDISDMTNYCPRYSYDELEFIDIPEGLQKEKITEPDYWEKLKHQYAGMAMQGMLSNCNFPTYSTEGYYKHNIANNAIEYATTLIKELKEEPNEGKALLYAVNKTAERTRKEILRKAEKWLMKYFVEDHYGMSPAGFGVFFQMFKQAMEE